MPYCVGLRAKVANIGIIWLSSMLALRERFLQELISDLNSKVYVLVFAGALLQRVAADMRQEPIR